MSSRPLPLWITAVNAVTRLLGVVAAAMIVLSVGVVCQMVFVRGVLGESSIWQTEFVTFAIIGATFLGAPYILHTRGHVAVDVLPLLLGARARRWLLMLGHLIALTFCGFFLYASVPWWHDAFVTGQTTPSIWAARMWIPFLSVPVGLGLLCLKLIAELWMLYTHRGLPLGWNQEPAK